MRYCDYGTLTDVRDCQSGGVFHRRDADFYQWFFLPESCLKPREKKYRPFTLAEFQDKFHIGLPINFREKGSVGNEQYLILNGYANKQLRNGTAHYIHIGSTPYTLDELFNEFEWQSHYTEDYQPFGVEE